MVPQLSIVVPFYDETAFLPLALQSIRAQGLDGVEIIVVNDNPDRFGTADLRALIGDDTVRLVVHDRNSGLSAARNSGIAAARGAWIGFLDADDYYLAGGLERHLARAVETGADIVHAATCLALGGSPSLQLLQRDRLLHMTPRETDRGLRGLAEAQFFVSSWSSLYRASFLHRSGLAFDPEQTRFEDRLFVLQSVTRARRIATLGQPVRVWRRRAGSISTRPSDAETHRLQLQLLEKCMAHFRSGPGSALPPLFRRRELFVTLGRLIWDMDILDAVLSGQPGSAETAARIADLLGEESFDNSFFNDALIAQVSRLGRISRRGVVTRRDFFGLHAALRSGDLGRLGQLLPPLTPLPRRDRDLSGPPAPRKKRPGETELVLHLGLHKTGTTWLQGQLRHHRAALGTAGILVPATGEDRGSRRATRPGAWAGHNGLAKALRLRHGGIWLDLEEEIRASGARRAVISCENLLFPFDVGRDRMLEELMGRLSAMGRVRVIATVRRPDRRIESLWRELVGNGRRLGARGPAEFIVDHGDRLTDLPALFAPVEAALGHPVSLIDADRAGPALWPAFLGQCGLTEAQAAALPAAPEVPSYPTPPAALITAARIANAMLPGEAQRIEVLRALFHLPLPSVPDRSFLSVAQRMDLIDRFVERSADWAAARGYAPPVEAWRRDLAAEECTEPPGPDSRLVERIIAARVMAELPGTAEPDPAAPAERPGAAAPARDLELRIALRPWLARLVRRSRRRAV